MGDFDINLINYNDNKNTGTIFLVQCSLNLFFLTLQHPLELQKTLKLKKKTLKFYSPFLWMGFNCLKVRATSWRQFTFYQ